MANNTFISYRTTAKALVSLLTIIFIGWIGWVSTSIVDAQVEVRRIEAIKEDVQYIRAQMDKLYEQLLADRVRGLRVNKTKTDNKRHAPPLNVEAN